MPSNLVTVSNGFLKAVETAVFIMAGVVTSLKRGGNENSTARFMIPQMRTACWISDR